MQQQFTRSSNTLSSRREDYPGMRISTHALPLILLVLLGFWWLSAAPRLGLGTLKCSQGLPLDHLFEQQPLWATATDDPEMQHATTTHEQ